MTIGKYSLAFILVGLSAASLLTASGETLRVAGTLTQIDGNSFTITDSEGQAVRVQCHDGTDFTRDGNSSNSKIAKDDFKVGDPVRSYYDGNDNQAKAVRMFASPTPASASTPATSPSQPLRVAGTLTQIDGNSFTITDSEGKAVRVLCNDATDYTRDKKPSNERIQRGDFKVGDPVRSYYDAANMTARAVRIFEGQ